jgi:serine/threonine protein kinase
VIGIYFFRLSEYKNKIGEKKIIAAKIINKKKAPKDFLNKFLPRELDIYLKLDHPNIIKIYEIIEISSKTFIFMELAEGGDLLEFIKVKILITLSLMVYRLIYL